MHRDGRISLFSYFTWKKMLVLGLATTLILKILEPKDAPRYFYLKGETKPFQFFREAAAKTAT
jgi:hypothetical protein